MRPEKSETPPPPPLPPPPQPSTPEAKPLIQNPEKQSKKISSTTDKSTNPLRGNLHRRAQSETTFRYGNELDLLVDPGDTSLDDELFSSFINVEQFRPKAEDLGADDRSIMAKGASETVETKKAMSSEELAELAVVDPKRAKRILANRQSAARSKERKARYISDLERKVQTLQTEATTLSAQLTLFQRDTTALNAENTELKIRLQSMEQQAQLQDALNEALKQEVQRLKVATGQVNSSSETFNSFGHSLDYNTSFFTLVPQKGPTINPPHPITLPNSSTSSNHKLHPPSKNVSGTTQQDQLDQFEGLDIGNGNVLHIVKSESSSISASGSSNTF